MASVYYMDSLGVEACPRGTGKRRSLSGGSFHQNCADLDVLKSRGSKLILFQKRISMVSFYVKLLHHKFPDDRDTQLCSLFFLSLLNVMPDMF